MRTFAKMIRCLDETTKTNDKILAIRSYLENSDAADAAWAVYFLTGQKLKRVVPAKVLRQWSIEESQIPEWLFEETYHWVGDLAETISAIVPSPASDTDHSLTDTVAELSALAGAEPTLATQILRSLWHRTGPEERFITMKLLTGSLRVGASKGLVIKAVAQVVGLKPEIIAHRLMGDWKPTKEFFEQLVRSDTSDAVISQPFPFALSHALENAPDALGNCEQYMMEWKWDGIRAQLIRRSGQTFVWSRGEERLDGRLPEIELAAKQVIGDFVLDGEVLAWRSDRPLPFSELQRRIGRKTVGKKILEDVPVIFMAFDLLELDGRDLRGEPLHQRRVALETLVSHFPRGIHLSARVRVDSWEQAAACRSSSAENQSEGLMLKRLDSAYPVGRVRGAWWKWKREPLTIDAVLIYAQPGHGRRAALFTDYTFGIWEGTTLVPFAKAYSGLNDEEILKVDKFIRQNTIDKFGPVRRVRPQLVMELAFENIQLSKRHKSGIAVRFPRILRWRHDKLPKDANQLSELKQMLEGRAASID
jgi:DNA ligase-1